VTTQFSFEALLILRENVAALARNFQAAGLVTIKLAKSHTPAPSLIWIGSIHGFDWLGLGRITF